jgi:hypothetical protein
MGRLEFSTLPVPAFAEHTVSIPAGVVTFGVEYRHLDEATILEFYGPDSRAKFDNKMPAGMTQVVEEDGLSLHVFATDSGHELLRFDCFDVAAHWHQLSVPDSRNVVIEHDVAAGGPLVDWALDALRSDLRGMLREAGHGDIADALDDAEVEPALATVAQTARYVAAAGRPVRVR